MQWTLLSVWILLLPHVCECFFRYRLTRVVPDKGPLNGCVCLLHIYPVSQRKHPISKHPINGPFPGLPGWAGTRKVKPIWIPPKQETVGGSGISWAICKSAPRSRQITTPAPHHSVFYRQDALPAAQPTTSKHWRKGVPNPDKIHVKFYQDLT